MAISEVRSKVIVLVLVLAAAVAVVNLIQNLEGLPFSETTGSGGVQGPRLILPNLGPEASLGLAVFFSLVGGGLFILVYLKYMPKGGKFPFEELLPLLVILLIFLSLVFLLGFFRGFQGEEDGEGPVTGDGSEGGTGDPSGEPGPRSILAAPALAGLLLVFFAFLAFSILIIAFRTRRPAAFGELLDEEMRQQVAASLEEGIYRLRVGDDMRSVILACYTEMLSLFEDRGVEAKKSLTARELESAALERLRLSDDSTKSLRELFEIARYSHYPLSETHRERAIDSLQRVKGELGV